MVKLIKFIALAVLGLLLGAVPALATPEIGKPAPDFSGVTSEGEEITLSDYAGDMVILEWTNHDCPFVRKHYESGNMQAIQKDTTKDGIVWLSVISSSPGTQGYVTAEEANRLTTERGAAPEAVILDPEGVIGKAYEARTTPHMYIIDGNGILVYKGGIDDIPTAKKEDLAKAKNYVRAALAEMAQGKAVSEASTRPYGCSVKYAE